MAPIKVAINDGTGKIYASVTLVALGRGYFAQQGLEVEFLEVGGRRQSMPLLTDGKVDVSPQSPSLDFFESWDPAHPMMMVADHGSVRPGRGHGAFVARTELIEKGLLRDYSDLRGKRIALGPKKGDHDWVEFATALRRGGLTFDDVVIVPMDFGEGRHRALAGGDIDLCTVGRLQSLVNAKTSGEFAVWKYRHEVCAGQPERAVIFGHRFWSERPDEAHRYVLGYLQGLRDYYAAFEEDTDRPAVEAVLAEQAQYSLEAIATDFIPTSVDPDGHVNVEALGSALDWFNAEGLLPQPIAVDHVVDHRYVDAALAELGPYRSARR